MTENIMWTQETCFAQRVQFRQSMHFIYLCPNHWLDLCVDWILREENRADVLTHSAAKSRFVAGKDCALGFGGGGREVGNLLPHPLAVAIRDSVLSFFKCCLRDPSPHAQSLDDNRKQHAGYKRACNKGGRQRLSSGPVPWPMFERLFFFFFVHVTLVVELGPLWVKIKNVEIHSKSRVENDVCGVIFRLDM